jgi:ATPase MipZ
MHVAVALMNCGHRVATGDLDSRQRSFTHYIENRRSWATCVGFALTLPTHFCIARGSTLRLDDNEAIEFSGFVEALDSVEETHDFIVRRQAWLWRKRNGRRATARPILPLGCHAVLRPSARGSEIKACACCSARTAEQVGILTEVSCKGESCEGLSADALHGQCKFGRPIGASGKNIECLLIVGCHYLFPSPARPGATIS